MPDVIFNEPRITQQQREAMRETSSFANWLVKKGIAKNEKEAIVISLVFVVVAVVVSSFLFFGINKKPNKIPQFREDISEEVKKKLPLGVLETIPSKSQP